jgi:hypothetical protein
MNFSDDLLRFISKFCDDGSRKQMCEALRFE